MSAFRNSAAALIAAILAGAASGQTVGGVEMRPLEAADPSATGLLSEAEGGFGETLWQSSTHTAIADLLTEMPVATASPAMNDLARRVLLTGARPADEASDGPNLFDLRTRKLAEAGLSADLTALLDVGGAKSGDPTARLEARLLTGQIDAVCAGEIGDDGPALQLRALCALHAGDAPAAALNAELARVKGVDDPAFFALIAHGADGAPLDDDAFNSLTPMNFALVRIVGAKLVPAALDDASAGLLAAIAADEGQSESLRAQAGETAAAMGSFSPGALADLLRALKMGGNEGVSGSAAQVRKAMDTEGLEPRAQAIARAFGSAGARGLTALYAQLLARPAWETPPSATLAPYADALTRILLLSGRGDRVADWLNIGPGLGEALIAELKIRAAIAAPSAERAAVAASALVTLVAAAGSDTDLTARALIYAGTLDALGFAVPSSAQSLLQSSPLMAGASAGQVEIAELAASARDKRLGETVLRALILLGRGGPAKAHPAVVIEAVAALSAVGLKREASAIALEAALARPAAGGGG